ALMPRLTAAFRFGWALEELVYRGYRKANPSPDDVAANAAPTGNVEFPPDLEHTRSEATLLENLTQHLIALEPSVVNSPDAQAAQVSFAPNDLAAQVNAVTPETVGNLGSTLIKWDLDIINQLLKNREQDTTNKYHYYDVLTAYEVGKAFSVTLWRITLDKKN